MFKCENKRNCIALKNKTIYYFCMTKFVGKNWNIITLCINSFSLILHIIYLENLCFTNLNNKKVNSEQHSLAYTKIQ